MTWTNPHPVGTGPYLLKSFNPETVTMVRNPHYWQAPKPYIKTLTFPAEASNTTTVLALAQDKIQWSGIFSFDLQRSYVSRNPQYNHVNQYPNGLDVLYVNLAHYPFNMLAVRKAISLALNRQAIANIGFSGCSPPVSNMTGVTPGMAKTWTTPALACQFPAQYNPGAATKLLERVGFKMGPNNTLLTPKGQPFNITIDVPTPFTDFAAASNRLRSNSSRSASMWPSRTTCPACTTASCSWASSTSPCAGRLSAGDASADSLRDAPGGVPSSGTRTRPGGAGMSVSGRAEAAPRDRQAPEKGRQGAPLELVGVHKRFVQGNRTSHILRGAALSVGAGEIVALVGESGSGKSTLARTVMRLYTPDEGVVRFAGEDVTGVSGRRLKAYRERAQMVFQDPFAALNPTHSVATIRMSGNRRTWLRRFAAARSSFAARQCTTDAGRRFRRWSTWAGNSV